MPSRMRHLLQVLQSTALERNPLMWLEIAGKMRGTTLTHPVFGTEMYGYWIDMLGQVKGRVIPAASAGEELARQLNARVAQAMQEGHRWW